MSVAQARHTNGGLTSPSKQTAGPRTSALIALQAECFYGLEEPNGFRYDDGPPVLARYLRCRAILPVEIPLQNASRVIATFKCLRKVDAPGRSGTASTAIETVFSKFTRVWPLQGVSSPEDSPLAAAAAASSEPSTALVVHSTNSALDFKVEVPAHLPQSIVLPGGAIYYTIQIQANLRSPHSGLQQNVIYSAESRVDVPPPDAAYSANRLPKRITNGVVGQAQDHYGILITPDISLHVSVPKEISYSRRTHSVFKIHLKLMPHPPEAKLPAIKKLDWKLTQRTNLGSLRRDSSPTKTSSHGPVPPKPARLAASSTELATGSIVMPTGQDAVSDVLSAAGRKDHYLYIAMPENSTVLLPMYEGNPLLEILHQLEIDLYLLPVDGNNADTAGHETSPKKRKTSRWSALFGGVKRKSQQAGGQTLPGRLYHAEIPIRLFFDLSELTSSSSTTTGRPLNGKGPAHQRLALRAVSNSGHSFVSS